MERQAAIKKLRKMLGERFAYRVDPRAPTPEQREAAKLELEATRAERERLKEMREARYQEVLAADAEYQRLKKAYSDARVRAEQLLGTTSHYKITVGTVSEIFFSVEAEGDSWEEVIAKLVAKRK